jgi:hypothetical protein
MKWRMATALAAANTRITRDGVRWITRVSAAQSAHRVTTPARQPTESPVIIKPW